MRELRQSFQSDATAVELRFLTTRIKVDNQPGPANERTKTKTTDRPHTKLVAHNKRVRCAVMDYPSCHEQQEKQRDAEREIPVFWGGHHAESRGLELLQGEHVVGAAVWLKLDVSRLWILFSDLRFRLADLFYSKRAERTATLPKIK